MSCIVIGSQSLCYTYVWEKTSHPLKSLIQYGRLTVASIFGTVLFHLERTRVIIIIDMIFHVFVIGKKDVKNT